MNTIQDTKENLQDPDFSDSSDEFSDYSTKNLTIGSLIGTRYKIIEILGIGGFGAVYKAKDLVLDEIVAIKILDQKFSSDKNTLERFKREIKLARKITHKNVVRIFDIDEVDNLSIISMEYFQGQSLKELIKKEGKITPNRAIDIGIQICSALHVAHKNGVIHRDIKPQNILINDEDVVKIVDFGIARSSIDLSTSGSSKEITKTGVIVGTPEYLSPEQVDGSKTLDNRTDIFSVGVVLYEMFTGDIPFKGNTAIATILKRINEDPLPLSKINPKLPPELDRIVVKTAMAKNVEERYKDILELSDDLKYLKEIPSETKKSKINTTIKTNRLPVSIQRQIKEFEKEGTSLYVSKQFEDSAVIWEKILELDPRDENAINYYRKASLKRDDVINKYKEAQYHYRKGSYRNCIKLLEEVISLFKDHTEALNLLEKARKKLNQKGDKAAGTFVKTFDYRTTGIGFKITCITLFILTGIFMYLQFVMNEPVAESISKVQTQQENSTVKTETFKPNTEKKITPTTQNMIINKKKLQTTQALPNDSFGYLTITDPKLGGKKTWAKIFIDGKFYNNTPQAKIKLKPGQYRISLEIQIENSTFKKEDVITIKTGEKKIISPIFTEANKLN
jgi:serine/threonine protein kinase